MALTNPCFKDQIGLIFGEEKIVKREKKRGRRGEEEEEGEKFKQSPIKVWKLTLIMNPM